jgi:hypothetical protein
MGVVTIGHGQIQHVYIEVMVAAAAIVLGISDVQVTWSATDGIAEFVQRALGRPQATGAMVT